MKSYALFSAPHFGSEGVVGGTNRINLSLWDPLMRGVGFGVRAYHLSRGGAGGGGGGQYHHILD